MTGKMRVLDLFSGIGGFSLGLERAGGFVTTAFCEIDPYARRVLRQHWPEVPVFRDIRTLMPADLAPLGRADIICGGFPCQDISKAGKGEGLDGARSGLWREYARIIGDVRPGYVVIENVALLRRRGLDRVLGDLADLGYDAEWHTLSAASFGAPHRRERLWVIAHTHREGRQRPILRAHPGPAGSWGWRGEADLCAIAERPFDSRHRFPQPLLRGMADGFPHRMDRLRAVGNAVVPLIAETIGLAILAAEATAAPRRAR